MTSFRADYDGIGQMLRSDDMQTAMILLARRMKAAAEADAPFDPDDRDGDHYRDHFAVTGGVRTPADGGTARAYGRLENDHVAAYQIEVGTHKTDAHHTLTRALDAVKD